MIPPSNFDEEIRLIKKNIEARLNEQSLKIVEEEIDKTLSGRIK